MPEITIDNKTYDVNPLLVEDSFDLQPKLIPILPEIGRLLTIFYNDVDKFAELDKADDDAETDEVKAEILGQFVGLAGETLEKVSPIFERIAKLVPPAELRYIRRTLLRDATGPGGTPLYGGKGDGDAVNIFFAGNTIGLWKLLIFAVKISYPDFFAIAASVKLLRKTRGASSPA